MRITPIPLVVIALTAACSAAPPATPVAVNTSPPAPAMPQLGELAAAARSTDKGPSQHNYTELYERLFLQWKNDPIKIFEIGIANGGSLQMWQEYFPKARIFAADIDPKPQFDNNRVTTLVADQANREQLAAAIKTAGGDIDILVDDGGHTMEQQQVSLGFLFPSVRPGGYYVIEDVHTSVPALWKGYGVARDGRNSTLRMLEDYLRSPTGAVQSVYMRREETAYLSAHIESLIISQRAASRSLMAVIRKKATGT